jgi:hypothetical protein
MMAISASRPYLVRDGPNFGSPRAGAGAADA